MYCVIETRNIHNEQEVSIVSKKWIVESGFVAFPPTSHLYNYLNTHCNPADDWNLYKFKMLKDNISKYN